MSATEASQVGVAAAQMTTKVSPTAAGARLLPLADVSHAYNVGGIPHTHYAQQTMHQLSQALIASRMQSPVVSAATDAALPFGDASYGPNDTTVCSTTAGTAGISHHAMQPQHTLDNMPQQHSHDLPQHQPEHHNASAESITAQQRQDLQQTPAMPETVNQTVMKPKQDMPLQQASDDSGMTPPGYETKPAQHMARQQAAEEVVATQDGPSTRTKALSQLIARARKLKDQLDAHASRKIAR